MAETNSNNNTNNKRFDDMLNLKKCSGQREYIGCTITTSVIKPDNDVQVTAGGKEYFSFRGPINVYNGKSTANYVGKMCGMEPTITDDGVMWTRVTFWNNGNNNMASRLAKLVAKSKENGRTLRLVVTGAITVKKNGDFVNTDIMGDSFWIIPGGKKNSNGNSNSSANTAAAPAQNAAPAAVPNGVGSDFVELEDADDLPF